jgi:hypothetical protein
MPAILRSENFAFALPELAVYFYRLVHRNWTTNRDALCHSRGARQQHPMEGQILT